MKIFWRKLKTSPNKEAFGYKEYLGDWFGDGYREVCELIGLPTPTGQEIYNQIQPILESGGTPETAQKLIRDNDVFIESLKDWGEHTNRQLSIMFCIEVSRRATNIRNFREWEQRSKNAHKRNSQIYGRLVTIDDRDHGICSKLNDVVLPFGHPWWQKNYPSHRIGCLCSVRILSQSQLERKNIEITPDQNLP